MAILASILWRRLDIPGHDTCRLEKEEKGWSLRGASIFCGPFGPVSLSYLVKCDLEWKTLLGTVRGIAGDRHIDIKVDRRDDGWTVNGAEVPGLAHLVDLDLNITPATNLIQLRRVLMSQNEIVQLPVAWLDVDTGDLTELRQSYERRSESELWYEAPSVGYKGLLVFDSNGFIRRYPNLWEAERVL